MLWDIVKILSTFQVSVKFLFNPLRYNIVLSALGERRPGTQDGRPLMAFQEPASGYSTRSAAAQDLTLEDFTETDGTGHLTSTLLSSNSD